MPLIALLTDLGLRDPYVGMIELVIADLAPGARVVSLGHEVPPHDIREGAFDLFISERFLPDGAVVCGVVDPGVGGGRRAVAVRVRSQDGRHLTLVGPDNGLFTGILTRTEVDHAVTLQAPEYRRADVSTTFEGRDVFAPAAAHLALGAPLSALGPRVEPETLVRLPWSAPRSVAGGWEADLVHHDQFGNLVTNLDRDLLGDDLGVYRVSLDGVTIGSIHRAFADVPSGRPLAYVGSSGLLEIAVRDGNAHRVLNVRPDTVVRVRDERS